MKFGRSVGKDEDRLAFVAKVPLERLTRHAHPCHFLKGARFCDGTQLFESAYYILSGSCELRAGVPDQSEEVVDRVGPGGVFGALETCSLGDPPLAAVATEDSVVLRIDRDNLELLRAQEPPKHLNGVNGHAHPSDAVLSLGSDGPRPPHQVVAMAFLSAGLPSSLISEQIARSLATETGAEIVLVRLEPCRDERTAPFLPLDRGRWPERPKAVFGFHSLTVPVQGGLASAENLEEIIGSLQRQFRYVLVQSIGHEDRAPWLIDFLLRSDVAYLFVEAGSAIDQVEEVIRQVRTRGGTDGPQVKPIACLADSQRIDGFDLLAERAATPIHLFVHGCPSGQNGTATAANLSALFKADLRRIARDIGGCLLGLALSSGAAKGFAHAGVIQVLEENGIDIDVVAGASMGAYVGALWAYGLDGTELERLARELEARWALWSLVDPVFPPRQGFLRGYAVKKRLMRSIGNVRFGELVRPLRVVAGNLATLDRIVFSAGEVATAVHASSAVPGICVPVTIDGETCIDGGVVDPLPVDVLREMGVTRVIAVDVIPTPERIRLGIQNGESGGTRLRKVLPLDQKLNYFARGNLLEILMRSVQGAQIRVAEASCRLADLVLRPDICDDRWLDYANPGRFIARGREEALRHLAEIKELAGRKTVNYERKPAQEPMASLA